VSVERPALDGHITQSNTSGLALIRRHHLVFVPASGSGQQFGHLRHPQLVFGPHGTVTGDEKHWRD